MIGPWKTDFESMACKTVLKKCLRYLPLQTEYVKALSLDESTETEFSEFDFADNMIDSDFREVT